VDPLNEAPMLALAMRQAYRREAPVAVVDPRPVALPFPFEHLAVPARELERCFKLLVKETTPGADPNDQNEPVASRLSSPALNHGSPQREIPQESNQNEPEGSPFRKRGQGDFFPGESRPEADSFPVEIRRRISTLAAQFKASRNPVLICGTGVVPETTPAIVGAGARSMLRNKDGGGLFYILPGPNAFGAALLDSTDSTFLQTLEAIERGEVKALIVVEADPLGLFPDRPRLERALSRLELLLVMDCLLSPTARQAHLFLPTLTVFETGSTFINQEGRIQFAHQAYHGGTPVSQVSGGGHPPRIYTDELPGGEPQPAWRMLADLAGILSGEMEGDMGEHPLTRAIEQSPLLQPLQSMAYPIDNFRCLPERVDAGPFPVGREEEAGRNGEKHLQLILAELLFGTEELSQYADITHQVEDEPCLHMHRDDAAALGFADGDAVVLTLDSGTLEVPVRLAENMARGTLVLPRHRRIDWQKVRAFPVLLPLESIKRA